MDLEGELWQKAAEWSESNYGICMRMRENVRGSWGVLVKGCSEDNCDEYDKCHIRIGACSFVAGSNWMMHRVKPIVYDKVIKDLVTNDSPYQDGPAFFEEKI